MACLPFGLAPRRAQAVTKTKATVQTHYIPFFLPRQWVGEHYAFARYCGRNNAGNYVTDKGRGVYGSAVWGDTTGGLAVWTQTTGAFYTTGPLISRPIRGYPVTEQIYQPALQLDAAVLWGEHAGGEFAPAHYTQPIALYLGTSTQI